MTTLGGESATAARARPPRRASQAVQAAPATSGSLLACLPDMLVCSILSWIDGSSIARLEVRREPAVRRALAQTPLM